MAKRDEAVEVAGVRITHPDDVLYPGQGITKRELAEYLAAVAGPLFAGIRGRPLTLVRCPEGEGGACFFQRHAGPGAPVARLRRVRVAEPDGGAAEFLVAAGERALPALAQMRVLEVHAWNARADRPDRPDRMVLDLDPGPDVAWAEIRDAALGFRERLAALGLASFAKTTGGSGLHVVAPLARRHGWDEVRAFARALAEEAERDAPERFVAGASRAARGGRIYVDYLRNAWGASIVAAYAPRSRPGAPVSVPLGWDEVAAGARPAEFTVRTVPARLAALRAEPWAGYSGAARQSLTRAARGALGL